MWDGSVSGPVSDSYIEEFGRKMAAQSNGIRDGRYAKQRNDVRIIQNEWELQLIESLKRELREIQSAFTKEDTFLAKEFKTKLNEFEETIAAYERNQCGSFGSVNTNETPVRPGIYKILMLSLSMVMWFVQIFPFRFHLSILSSIFFAGLFSIALVVGGHIIGRLFSGANDKNEKQVLGMILLTAMLLLLFGLYGYLYWRSIHPDEVFLIIGAGVITLFLFVGMIYASYKTGDPHHLCIKLRKRRNELNDDLDRIHYTRKQNMKEKNDSIKKFENYARRLVYIYRNAYEREVGEEINWPELQDISHEFICSISDPNFDKWESRSQNLLA